MVPSAGGCPLARVNGSVVEGKGTAESAGRPK